MQRRAVALFVVAIGCSSEASPAADAAVDAATTTDADALDAPACDGSAASGAGETCIGYGPSPESCPAGCGQPYGYVCFGGPPPGFSGCRETRVSAVLGNSYCCANNACVAEPDRDGDCTSVSGKPHRFQCPPDGTGGHVAAPAGCVEHGSGSTDLERFFCCP